MNCKQQKSNNDYNDTLIMPWIHTIIVCVSHRVIRNFSSLIEFFLNWVQKFTCAYFKLVENFTIWLKSKKWNKFLFLFPRKVARFIFIFLSRISSNDSMCTLKSVYLHRAQSLFVSARVKFLYYAARRRKREKFSWE